MPIQWNDGLSVGICSIDAQHRELIDRINKLLDAMSRGVGTDEVEGTVTFLERYVDKHFGDEERLLRTWRYPAFEAHKAMHDRFVQELRELKADLRAGKSKTLLTLQIQRKVSDWLVNHIKKSDMEYASFARKAA